MRSRPALLALLLSLASWPAGADIVEVPIDLPPGEIALRIPFEVEHPGTVRVDATWTGGRVLSFRIEDPAGAVRVIRQSGPSPQRLKIEIPARALAGGPVQRILLLRSYGARDGGSGQVTLTLPEDPALVRAREEARRPKPPPPPPPDPWTVAATAPAGEAARFPVFQAVERYRQAVIAEDGARRPDACGWQDDLLRRMAGWRDAAEPLDVRAAELLRRIAAAVATVEALRTTTDPILAGPTPEPGLRRRAWSSLREQRLRPIHVELDRLTERATRDLPASLSGEAWPARMVACLVSGERQVEAALAEREPQAPTAPGPAQHAALLAAAEALRALTGP